MEKIKTSAYIKPSYMIANIRTNLICSSTAGVEVGGKNDKPFDAKLRGEKENLLIIE